MKLLGETLRDILTSLNLFLTMEKNMKILATLALAVAMITPAIAGPMEYHEYNNVVGADSSHVYTIAVGGDGWATAIYLRGGCETPQQDIDLWVYEGDRLLAKETGNGCNHEIFVDTIYGRYGTIRVVVENENKPFNTSYYLKIE